MFHVLGFSLLLEFFLMHLFSAGTDVLFCIADLFLGFSLEVLGHPLHFFDQEVPVSLLLLLGRLSGDPNIIGSGPTRANLVLKLS